jgi:hypothetical protein
MIPAVVTHCAGIDIGKRVLAVCLMVGPADAEPKVEVREFSAFTADLVAMKEWLLQAGCTHVVMESTGPYWKPVFNVLEGSLAVCLANAEDVKGRKGHKTDRIDAQWLAHLLRHDMIRASFVPPRPIRWGFSRFRSAFSSDPDHHSPGDRSARSERSDAGFLIVPESDRNGKRIDRRRQQSGAKRRLTLFKPGMGAGGRAGD